MREFSFETPTEITHLLSNGSREHIQKLALLGWSLERIAEYFQHELTPEQIWEWVDELAL